MIASELRLGNLITSDGEIFTVDEIRGDFVRAGALGIYSAGFHLDDYYIPLTSEWLERLGFEQKWDDYMGEIPQWEKGPICWQSKDVYAILGHWVSEPELCYIHQLQNLYFVLTGTELEKK